MGVREVFLFSFFFSLVVVGHEGTEKSTPGEDGERERRRRRLLNTGNDCDCLFAEWMPVCECRRAYRTTCFLFVGSHKRPQRWGGMPTLWTTTDVATSRHCTGEKPGSVRSRPAIGGAEYDYSQGLIIMCTRHEFHDGIDARSGTSGRQREGDRRKRDPQPADLGEHS